MIQTVQPHFTITLVISTHLVNTHTHTHINMNMPAHAFEIDLILSGKSYHSVVFLLLCVCWLLVGFFLLCIFISHSFIFKTHAWDVEERQGWEHKLLFLAAGIWNYKWSYSDEFHIITLHNYQNRVCCSAVVTETGSWLSGKKRCIFFSVLLHTFLDLTPDKQVYTMKHSRIEYCTCDVFYFCLLNCFTLKRRERIFTVFQAVFTTHCTHTSSLHLLSRSVTFYGSDLPVVCLHLCLIRLINSRWCVRLLIPHTHINTKLKTNFIYCGNSCLTHTEDILVTLFPTYYLSFLVMALRSIGLIEYSFTGFFPPFVSGNYALVC